MITSPLVDDRLPSPLNFHVNVCAFADDARMGSLSPCCKLTSGGWSRSGVTGGIQVVGVGGGGGNKVKVGVGNSGDCVGGVVGVVAVLQPKSPTIKMIVNNLTK